ncbi:MAG TPA: thiamine phosphate synthase, partial [Thermomicrobiales bacterium]|nr:thiamine phosphate synthase [Thermomicrobiales bacterium]
MKPVPRLMLIVGRERVRGPLPEFVAAVVDAGVDAVQVREPGLPPEALQALAAPLLSAVDGQAALLVNREVAVAAALGVGVHLPERGESPAAARRRLGPAPLVGRSVHGAPAAAAAAGADYLLAGHLFPTSSHPGQAPLGLPGLRRIVAAAPCPALAVGGIDADNAAEAIRAGARGVAVIGAIVDAPEPARAATRLRAAVDAALAEEGERMEPSGTATERASIEVVV